MYLVLKLAMTCGWLLILPISSFETKHVQSVFTAKQCLISMMNEISFESYSIAEILEKLIENVLAQNDTCEDKIWTMHYLLL